MADQIITVALTDCAADHDPVALIAPLGIDTEFQAFQAFEAPAGWQSTIVAETRTGQRAAVMVPADRATAAGQVAAAAPPTVTLTAAG